jgi:hypothetical protein
MKKGSISPDELKEDFISRYQRSKDKTTLFEREVEIFSLIFDEEKVPLTMRSNETIMGREQTLKDVLKFSRIDLWCIRRAYYYFVVNGEDISKAGDLSEEFLYDMNFPQDEIYEKGVYYANLAVTCFDYLQWLKQDMKQPSRTNKRSPIKYYAWYHKILIAIGKADAFAPGDKKAIQALGENKYGCGGTSGFYQHFIDFNLNKKETIVNSLKRDRKTWKNAIIAISNNDIDVIRYLERFPN